MQMKIVSGASLAAAAIALAVSGAGLTSSPAQAKKAAVHCMGINTCKGMGFLLKKSTAACTSAGGTVG